MHRVLKPENVFITSGAQLKVLDFELASNRLAPLGHEVADMRARADFSNLDEWARAPISGR